MLVNPTISDYKSYTHSPDSYCKPLTAYPNSPVCSLIVPPLSLNSLPFALRVLDLYFSLVALKPAVLKCQILTLADTLLLALLYL